MSISELGSLGEFVSAVAVLVTLIYLSLQIRQNTHATRAVSHHAVTDALNQLNLTIGRDPELMQLWLSGMSNRSALNKVQCEQFDTLLRAYLHICDTMYYQARVGAGDSELWDAEKRYVAITLTSPGGKEWLEINSQSISSGFRTEVFKTIEQHKISSTDSMLTSYHLT